jgi:tRNA pseudouridine38-40 synthase
VGGAVNAGCACRQPKRDALFVVPRGIVNLEVGALCLAGEVILRQRGTFVGQMPFGADDRQLAVEALVAQRLGCLGAREPAADDDEVVCVRHEALPSLVPSTLRPRGRSRRRAYDVGTVRHNVRMSRPDVSQTRLRLDLSYDGTEFSGWARQPGLRTVEGTLSETLARVLRLSEVGLTVAGRTDAGVHARGQVAHADIPAAAATAFPPVQLPNRLARALPDDVRVRRVSIAPGGFDARFSALWRRYVYRIVDEPAAADPLQRRSTLTWPRRLDDAAMGVAGSGLLGEHDFAAFCKRRDGATTVRTLLDVRVERQGPVIGVTVRADAFCHAMVRSLVGALLAVGEGRHPPEWPSDILRAGVRDARVTVVPPQGLTLEEVGYPAADAVAERAAETRAIRTPP